MQAFENDAGRAPSSCEGEELDTIWALRKEYAPRRILQRARRVSPRQSSVDPLPEAQRSEAGRPACAAEPSNCAQAMGSRFDT